MKNFIKTMDNLPWILKLIFALPFLDGLVWGIYRIVKGINKNDGLMIVAGIIWLLVGWAILWIIDIITIILYKKVTFFA